jgi:hypothetical protein
LLPPTEMLAMFMAQAPNVDQSCQKAINEFSVRRVTGALGACSTSTAAYCRARKRVPQHMASSVGVFHRASDDRIASVCINMTLATGSFSRWHDSVDG